MAKKPERYEPETIRRELGRAGELIEKITELELERDRAIVSARFSGASWVEIGRLLEMSPQGTRKKYLPLLGDPRMVPLRRS